MQKKTASGRFLQSDPVANETIDVSLVVGLEETA